ASPTPPCAAPSEGTPAATAATLVRHRRFGPPHTAPRPRAPCEPRGALHEGTARRVPPTSSRRGRGPPPRPKPAHVAADASPRPTHPRPRRVPDAPWKHAAAA